MVYFLRHRLQMKRTWGLGDVLCAGAITLFYSLYLFWNLPLLDTAVVIIPFVYSIKGSDEKWSVCLFWNIVLMLVFTSTASLTALFYQSFPDITWEQLMQSTGVRIIFVISGNALLTLFIFGIAHCHRHGNAMHYAVLGIFLLLIFLLLAVTELLFVLHLRSFTYHDRTFIILCSGMLLCCFLTLVLYEMFAKNTERQVRIQTELEHVRMNQQYQDELRGVYERITVYRHDIKHQIQVVEQLLIGQNVSDAERYLDKVKRMEQEIPACLTGNLAVDALLTAKLLVMRERQIRFRYDLCPLCELPVDEILFCAVVGNLLDNAIEGVGRLQEEAASHAVRFSLSRRYDTFMITCENDVESVTLRRQGGKLITSKGRKGYKDEPHGVGIRSVERIVREAEGICTFTASERRFYVRISLPYSK